MLTLTDILEILGVVAVAVTLVLVLQFRRRGKADHDLHYSTENVCPHLKPALDLLLERGNRVKSVGQVAREFPLEIHLVGKFDPQGLYDELKMEPPAQVSERGVLFCKDDWCEIHPGE